MNHDVHGVVAPGHETASVPEHETIVHVFEAPGVDVRRRAAMLAGLPFDRIVEAVEGTSPASGADEKRAGGAV